MGRREGSPNLSANDLLALGNSGAGDLGLAASKWARAGDGQGGISVWEDGEGYWGGGGREVLGGVETPTRNGEGGAGTPTPTQTSGGKMGGRRKAWVAGGSGALGFEGEKENTGVDMGFVDVEIELVSPVSHGYVF